MDLKPTPINVVHNKPDSPVFVIGNTRSGTTMLVRLMRKYLHINYGPETQFILRYYHLLSAYGDLKTDNNFYKLAKDISKERFFERANRNFDFVFDMDQLMEETVERTYPAMLSNMFQQFARQQGMPRWGDKTPAYLHDLPVIDRLFPDAQYVHIVRDGRDVALSQFNTHFGPKNVYRAAKEWRNAIQKIQHFSKKVGPSRFMELRYEDMLADPVPTFERLIPFLEIDDSGNQVIATIKEQIHSDLRKGNFYKWEAQFSHAQKKIFEQAAADMLTHYGYSTVFKQLTPLTSPEKLFWEAHNMYKRALRRDAWQDNFYKISVKWKQFYRSMGR